MIIVLDFETYWSDEFTLQKIPNFEYVTSDHFRAHGVAVEEDNGSRYWVTHRDLPGFFEEQNYMRDDTVVMHNAYFDALIASWHYRIEAKAIHDTRGMANLLVKPHTQSSSLHNVDRFFGGSGKMPGELVKTKGVEILSPAQEKALIPYALKDATDTMAIYHEMLPEMSDEELALMDLHIKLYLRKRMRIDIDKLTAVESQHLKNKARVEQRVLATWPELMADPKLTTWEILRRNSRVADIIKAEGTLPPRKRSLTTGKLGYAFAKTDFVFQALAAESDNLALLVEAKTLANSTLLENRLMRLRLMHGRMDGWAYPLLNYCGAHTARSSGGDRLNFQNIPKKPLEFRHIFIPPVGNKVVICDSGQIEARVLAWMAGQIDLLDDFKESDELVRQGKDPKALGLDVYTKMAKRLGSDERDLGKATVLGCGFGLSENGFVLRAKADRNTTPEEVLRSAWGGWRDASPHTIRFWHEYEKAFRVAALGRRTVSIGPLTLEPWLEDGLTVWLPSGRPMRYGKVRNIFGQLTCSRGSLWYGGLTENCIGVGTPVMTDRGWVPIEQVSTEDRLWDGLEWGYHKGSISKGWQHTMQLHGVPITPDHRVLVNEQTDKQAPLWRPAAEVTGYHRATLWKAGCLATIAKRKIRLGLGTAVRLWGKATACTRGPGKECEAWGDPSLSGLPKGSTTCFASISWDEQAPSVRRVEGYAGALSSALSSGMAQLWSAGYPSLRRMGGFLRGLLEGHGADLRVRVDPGPQEQRGALRERELSVGFLCYASQQQEGQSVSGHPGRQNDRGPSLPEVRHRTDNHPVPAGPRTAPLIEVFDILNCGPRNRFVVKADQGPMIVHNCVQAVARDVVFYQTLKYPKLCDRLWLLVHDEIDLSVPEAEAQDYADMATEALSTPLDWCADLPVIGESKITDQLEK